MKLELIHLMLEMKKSLYVAMFNLYHNDSYRNESDSDSSAHFGSTLKSYKKIILKIKLTKYYHMSNNYYFDAPFCFFPFFFFLICFFFYFFHHLISVHLIFLLLKIGVSVFDGHAYFHCLVWCYCS